MITNQITPQILPSNSCSLHDPVKRVNWLTTIQGLFIHEPSSNKPHTFSLLRFLGLASLFVGVRSQLFPAELELFSLNGALGFTLNGDEKDDNSGWSVSNAGDVNGDGFADLLIGAFAADPAGLVSAGKTYVVFGKVGLGTGGTVGLSSLDGKSGFVLIGDEVGELSGYSVSSAGDVNGDGVPDLLIGAAGADPGTRANAGKAYVVFGKVGLGASGTVELSSLNGTNGFALNGVNNADNTGFSVSSGGDVNGDQISDLLIGAYFASPSGRITAGKTYVVFGKVGLGASGTVELSSLDGTNGFTLYGAKTNEMSGVSVSGAGDVNDDGVSDILIGARSAKPDGRTGAGKSYVVFGKVGLGASGTVELSSLDGTTGFMLNGVKAGDNSGWSVSGAGDVNGDGVSDLLIGARLASPTPIRSLAGKTHVVFGKKGLGAVGTVELLSLDGTSGFTINGASPADYSGTSVSCAGDVNGDGMSDILIGANGANAPAQINRISAGKTYVVFGKVGLGSSGTFELSSLDGTNGFSLIGVATGDESGFSVSSAGDVNGDGVSDFLIGARYASVTPTLRAQAGKTYVVFGRKPADTPSTTPVVTVSLFSLPSTISSPRAFPQTTPLLSPSSNRAITQFTASRTSPGSLTLPMTIISPSMSEGMTKSEGAVTSPIVSPEETSLGPPLVIAGGICALVSAVAAAAFVVRRKCFSNKTGEIEMEEPAIASVETVPGPNTYDRMPAAPTAYGDTSFSALE